MINVLWASLSMLGVGIVAAVLLVITDKFFGVKKDEKVEEIRSYLPGANCGACGFTGCDGYAEAVARGEALCSLCIPGGKDTAEKIGAITGGEVADVKGKRAVVLCRGTLSSSEVKCGYTGSESCRAKCMVFGGVRACNSSCLGCGDCAAVCPTEAISVVDGVARIRVDKCIGCGKCVKACPKKIISLLPEDFAVAVACSNEEKGAVTRKKCKNGCIGCKKCENTCKWGAITVVDNLARIDYEKCTGCGECAAVCPVKCIITHHSGN